jgi:hypothetical protein
MANQQLWSKAGNVQNTHNENLAIGRHAVTTTLWGIHGGRDGSADPLFREKGLLALAWTALGDLSQLGADRGAFRTALVEAYPEILAGAVPVEAGVLFRFVHEMAVGDLVAYPSREDRCIHLFEVKGPYQYDASEGADFPHRRQAKLVKSLPRGSFTQPALNEIGAAITLFKIRTNTTEFLTKLADQAPETPKPASADPEPETPSSGPDFSESTQDFVIGRLGLHLKGHPFAHFVGHGLTSTLPVLRHDSLHLDEISRFGAGPRNCAQVQLRVQRGQTATLIDQPTSFTRADVHVLPQFVSLHHKPAKVIK